MQQSPHGRLQRSIYVQQHWFCEYRISSYKISQSESHLVGYSTGNLRQKDASIKIGSVRVSKREQNEALQIDALEEAGCEKWYVEKVTGSKAERNSLQEALACARPRDTLMVWKLDRAGRSLKHLIELLTYVDQHQIGFKSLMKQIDTTTPGGKLIFHLFLPVCLPLQRRAVKPYAAAGSTHLLKTSMPHVVDCWPPRSLHGDNNHHVSAPGNARAEQIQALGTGMNLWMGALAEFERDLIRERTHAGLAAARIRERVGGRPRKLKTSGKVALARQMFAEQSHSIPEICATLGICPAALYRYVKKAESTT
jgi:DNA invertase Pin-like site-specific DNA recombinase